MTLKEKVKNFKPRTKPIPIPEFDGVKVYIRTMSAAERVRLHRENEEMRKKGESSDQAEARMASYALCDEKGLRLFAGDEVSTLAELDGPVIARIVKEWLTFNGLGAAAEAEKEKNS